MLRYKKNTLIKKITWIFFWIIYFNSFWNINHATRGGGRRGGGRRDVWGLCAVILQKKCPDFGKMCTVCVYRWFKFSKRSIKSIFDKKHQNFSFLGTAFMCRPWKVYRNTLISRNLLCPEKLLIARLNISKRGSDFLVFEAARNF